MKTLHLVLKHKWYDKIASGEKTSEYRECSPYWNRIFTGDKDSTRIHLRQFVMIKPCFIKAIQTKLWALKLKAYDY